MDRRLTRYAEKKAGKHNKFYEVRVEEHETGQARLTFVYGRIGTSGRELDQGLMASYNYAVQTANEQFESKLGKGYVEVCAMQAIASALEDPSERKFEGALDPVEPSIPSFGVPLSITATRERCKSFCQKYVDKLNVIRGSRRVLGFRAYRKQINDLLDSYDKEWTRILDTQAHGNYLRRNNVAQDAYRAFRKTLRGNAGINPAHVY